MSLLQRVDNTRSKVITLDVDKENYNRIKNGDDIGCHEMVMKTGRFIRFVKKIADSQSFLSLNT